MRLVFALAVAVILVRNTRMTPIYRAVYYLPSIIGGSVAVSILWKRIFATDGVINALLAAVGSLAVWFLYAYLFVCTKTDTKFFV